nr:hypothetical transcript [Hymenolepis microstoma]
MGKKKVKDFNKVKLKLGRTLKRQNETVVDLSKKKIFLPKEKTQTKHDVPKESNEIFYEYVEGLKSSSESSQLHALFCIQSVLQPYVLQINSDWNAQPFVYCNEISLKSLNSLLGFDIKQGHIALQFGDLFESIDKLSRHSTSGRIPSEIAKLCAMIATIFSVHPRIFSGAFAIDFISLSLLHRSEFWFRISGVKVLADLMEARYRVLTSLLCVVDHSSSFSNIDELQILIDAVNYSARRRTYTRLLIRHYESLHENKSFDAISSRKTLLKATMKYFRDIQYILYITPVVPLSIFSTIKLHPFLTTVDLSSLHISSSFGHSDANLSSTWMLKAANPILDKVSNSSVVKEDKSGPKSNSAPLLTKVQEDLALDSNLVYYVLKESHYLLDGDHTYHLIHIMCNIARNEKRVMSLMDSSEVLPAILKFIKQLCELVPPDSAGDTIVPELAPISSANANSSGAGNGLSRKQLKQLSKRSAKLARRKTTKNGDGDGTTADQNSAQSNQTPSRLSKSEVLSHLLKQQTLLLVWTLATDGATLNSNLSQSLMIHDYAQSLASFLLSTTNQEDSELPSLGFLNQTSPALSWRWIHTLDFCLLYNARIRRITPKRSESLRCLTASMITAFAYIVRRWCRRQTSSASKVSPRAPRIVVRATGVLTAFLYQELERQRFHPSAANHPLQINDTWIRTALNNFSEVTIPNGMDNPLMAFVDDLCDLVEKEAIDVETNKSKWIWAAACLNSLAELQCINVCERLKSSSVLTDAVYSLKSWTHKPTVLEDSLMNLPSTKTATYPFVKSWKCLPIERIYAQDGASG